jgi:6-phosphogluconolactonase
MELVVAPIDELRPRLTQAFEAWAAGSPVQGFTGSGVQLSCALSGGATALLFLGALRNAQVDWTRITLYWADERAVPADHNESNYGVAKRMLLDPLGAKAPRAVRMPADRPNLGEAALYYDATLAHDLKNGPLDLALLGVGEDGHICALFPGHRALLVDDIRVVAIEDAPKPPPRRLSLTLRYVLQTRQIWLIAVGPRKLPALQMALTRTQRSTPLDLLLQQGKNVTVFTDQVIRRA